MVWAGDLDFADATYAGYHPMAPTMVIWTGLIRIDRMVIPLAAAGGKWISWVVAGVDAPGGVTRSAFPTAQVAAGFSQAVHSRPANAVRLGRTVTGIGLRALCTRVVWTTTGSSAAFVRATAGQPPSEQECLEVLVNVRSAAGEAPARVACWWMTRTASCPEVQPGADRLGGWGRLLPVAAPLPVGVGTVLALDWLTAEAEALAVAVAGGVVGGVEGAIAWPVGTETVGDGSRSPLPQAASPRPITIAPATPMAFLRVRRRMRLPPFVLAACGKPHAHGRYI